MTAVRRPTLPVLPPAAAVAQMMNFHGYLILDAFVAFLDGKKKGNVNEWVGVLSSTFREVKSLHSASYLALSKVLSGILKFEGGESEHFRN